MPENRRRLRTREAAEYVGLKKSTLDKLRIEGGGPAFLKLGRAVVYDISDLDEWCASGRRTSTSEYKRRPA
ncbi:helix-turn-helix transcriptional regulator [Sinorhizobium medicae]|uniref:helix-turn-helix transcriptional regulator n=1 Tax=Sinorhizobium medicae TaxID=110321 RepID=UPI00192E0127|nr:helix-turn-helix domain-containing protein [Sinorhizobium medicae]